MNEISNSMISKRKELNKLTLRNKKENFEKDKENTKICEDKVNTILSKLKEQELKIKNLVTTSSEPHNEINLIVTPLKIMGTNKYSNDIDPFDSDVNFPKIISLNPEVNIKKKFDSDKNLNNLGESKRNFQLEIVPQVNELFINSTIIKDSIGQTSLKKSFNGNNVSSPLNENNKNFIPQNKNNDKNDIVNDDGLNDLLDYESDRKIVNEIDSDEEEKERKEKEERERKEKERKEKEWREKERKEKELREQLKKEALERKRIKEEEKKRELLEKKKKIEEEKRKKEKEKLKRIEEERRKNKEKQEKIKKEKLLKKERMKKESEEKDQPEENEIEKLSEEEENENESDEEKQLEELKESVNKKFNNFTVGENNSKKNKNKGNKGKKTGKDEEIKVKSDKDSDDNSVEEIGFEIEDYVEEEQPQKKSEKKRASKKVSIKKEKLINKEIKDKKNGDLKQPNENTNGQPGNEIRNNIRKNGLEENQENLTEAQKKTNENVLNNLDENKKKILNEVREQIFNLKSNKVVSLGPLSDYKNLTLFDENEETLPSMILNFKDEIIVNEGRNILELRRNRFMQRRFLGENKGKINQENQEIIETIAKCKISHPDLMRKIYQEKGETFLDDINDIEEGKIFSKDMATPKDKNNYTLGKNLENFLTFCNKYSVYNNYKLMKIASEFFDYWRESLCDGDSLYRVFMFLLIENNIIYNKCDDLKCLLCDMVQENYKTIYTDKKIDYETVFSILKLIINYLKEKKIELAYELFIKAYQLEDRSFDLLLVAYLRRLIFDYASETLDIFEKTEEKKGKTIKKDNFINLKIVETNSIEPEFLILAFLPYLFDVKLIFFYIEGDFNFGNAGTIDTQDESDDPLINIGWFYGGFYPIYSKEYKNNKFFETLVNKSDTKLKKLTYLNKELEHCDKCDKDTDKLVFLEKKFKTCHTCLTNHLNKIIENRAKTLFFTEFTGLEFYTRPIHLKDNYYVSDYEFTEIFNNKNIYSALNIYIRSICFSCYKSFENPEDLYLNEGCFCQYCIECLNKKIDEATKDFKILNNYEKTTFEKKNCECKKYFNLENALKIAQFDEEFYTKAKERMIHYVNTFCLSCLKIVSEGTLVDNNPNYKLVRIEKENDKNKGIDYCDNTHAICNLCYKKIKQKEEEKSSKKNIRSNRQIIFCKICTKNHYLIQQIGKSKGGGCCIIL